MSMFFFPAKIFKNTNFVLDEKETGRFAFRNGKWVKVSDTTNIKDTLHERHKINADHDTFQMYKRLENEGKLREVNDDWQGFLKNYKEKYKR